MSNDCFETFLQTLPADFTFKLPGNLPQETWDFYLNPRYLRGSDFLMRWSQGRWAEQIVTEAIKRTNEFICLPYGPSGVAPEDPRELEAYFERLGAVKQVGKRPDMLVFSRAGYGKVAAQIERVGRENIPFTPEADLKGLLKTAIIAVEVENSLWVGKEMPHFGKGKPMKGFPDLIGFARSHKVPTIIVKKEDFTPLKEWQDRWNVPIYIFHTFYDAGYFLAFDKAQEYVRKHVVEPTTQTFYAPGGPTTTKDIFKFWYTLASPLGTVTVPPTLTAKFIKDKNGHILPYVFFSGGRLELSEEVLDLLRGCTGS